MVNCKQAISCDGGSNCALSTFACPPTHPAWEHNKTISETPHPLLPASSTQMLLVLATCDTLWKTGHENAHRCTRYSVIYLTSHYIFIGMATRNCHQGGIWSKPDLSGCMIDEENTTDSMYCLIHYSIKCPSVLRCTVSRPDRPHVGHTVGISRGRSGGYTTLPTWLYRYCIAYYVGTVCASSAIDTRELIMLASSLSCYWPY